MIFVLPISNPGFQDFPSTGGILKSGIRNGKTKIMKSQIRPADHYSL
jgi:hypothetical protein